MGGSRVTNAAAALIGRGVVRASRAIGGAVSSNVARGVAAGESRMKKSQYYLSEAGKFAKETRQILREPGSDASKSAIIDAAGHMLNRYLTKRNVNAQLGAEVLGNKNVARREAQLSTAEKRQRSTSTNRIKAFDETVGNFFGTQYDKKKITKGVAALTGRNASSKKGV